MQTILEFTFNLYNLLQEPLRQEASLNHWDLFFKRYILQPLVMIFFLMLEARRKPQPLLV